jgi:hypothetical protein
VSSTFPSGTYTESRIGIVSAATPNTLFVDVGGTVIEVAFVIPFMSGTVVAPAPGSIVQLVRQDASWVALGKIVGRASNSIVNPSFEDSPSGIPPVGWVQYNISGGSTALVLNTSDALGGSQVVRVASEVSSVHYLYSSPILVTSGQIWSLSAFVGGDYVGGPATADSALVALWFASDTDLYPTTSSADIVVDTVSAVPQYPPFQSIAGNVTAPVTGFMRVALRSTLAATQALVWDVVVARLV